jgi:integrase
MASLQAGHARSCERGKRWTTIGDLDGCTCRPTYYIVVRDGSRNHMERIGKNRKNAERALRKTDVQIDEGSYEPIENVRFREWGEQWRASLERKETTIDSYKSTIDYATEAFGDVFVRRLQPGHLAKLNDLLKERKLSASTRAKHLRVLNACLSSAVEHNKASRIPKLPKAERPRPTRKEAAYFENDEIPPLFQHIDEGVYRVLFLVALKTGCRIGELTALTWGDLDLVEAVIRVRRSYTDGHLSTPKNHERRDVDLTEDLVELLGAWWGELGKPDDSTLVFPGETPSGYLSATTVLRRELYPAMKAAKVARVGPTGEKRTFHSFRHTYAKRALENGRRITWLYGHFERAERKKEAELMAGVFGV